MTDESSLDEALLTAYQQVISELRSRISILLRLIRVPILVSGVGLLVVSTFGISLEEYPPRPILLLGLGTICILCGFTTASVGYYRVRVHRRGWATPGFQLKNPESLEKFVEDEVTDTRTTIENISSYVETTFRFYVVGAVFVLSALTTTALSTIGIPPSATLSVTAFAYIVFELLRGDLHS